MSQGSEIEIVQTGQPVAVSPVQSGSPHVWYGGVSRSDGVDTDWWYGSGPPGEIPNAEDGDMYLDVLTGNVYSYLPPNTVQGFM